MAGNRKLAAILMADIVGFSRLTALDEDRTVARVRAVQSEVIDPAIATHHGRLVKKTGDGALVEFRSVVDAVRCAIEVQTLMGERNAGELPEQRLELRVGIHMGDVIEEADGDIMGDGVNIAARLEGLAAPGAICLSEDAYRLVRSRLDVAVTDLGENRLKNIAEPMRVYSLMAGMPASPASGTALAPATTATHAPQQDKPSIAVLPFTNMSGDAEQEYFVDGMVEDIITALSRFEELFVVARNSTFVYKGRAVEIRQVGRDLGVRYVLEGSVRKAGDRLRITGQLIDAATGTHLWADRFDGRLADVFDLQDEITANVVGALEPTMRKAEIERARRKPAENMGAYDLYLQALPHIYAIRPDENMQALGLLERAIALDGNYAPALAHAGWCLVQRTTRAWSPFGSDDMGQAVTWARRALAAGSDDAKAVVLGGFVLVMLRQDYSAGLDALSRAVAMNPGSGFVNGIAGSGLTFGGETVQGRRFIDRAIELCPNDPSLFSFLTVAATGELFLGNAEAAVELARRSLALNPLWDSTHWVLISAHMALGQADEARAIAAKLLSVYPESTVANYERVLPMRSPDARAMVIQSLRAAGVPE